MRDEVNIMFYKSIAGFVSHFGCLIHSLPAAGLAAGRVVCDKKV